MSSPLVLVIGALVIVNLTLLAVYLGVKAFVHRAPASDGYIKEMRLLAESAFAHIRANSAEDAARAASLTIASQSEAKIKETLSLRPEPEKTSLETMLDEARAGTLVVKDKLGQTRILEPLIPGDAL